MNFYFGIWVNTSTTIPVTIAFFEYKLEDKILGHQCQTVDPEDIHIGARLVVQPIE
jgi:hypothetical protein